MSVFDVLLFLRWLRARSLWALSDKILHDSCMTGFGRSLKVLGFPGGNFPQMHTVLLCLRHVEPEPLEPAGPKEAWFILCPVKYALWTVCRPSLFININNPQLWPPAGLFQALSSVLPSDSIYLTLDLLASFLKGSAWDRAMLGARKVGSVL